MSLKIAIASRSLCNHGGLRQELKDSYPHATLIWNDTNRVFSGEELIGFLKGADRAIVGLEKMDLSVIESLPELKHVSKYGVGLDGLDLKTLAEHGKTVGWTAGVNKRSVAELTLTFMLLGVRNVVLSAENIRQEKWVREPGRQLTKKKVGIIGCGNIGKELVDFLKPFECDIKVNDIKPDLDFYKKNKLVNSTLEEIYEHCEIITVHVPLNSKTKGMISEKQFAGMKCKPFLINTARGGIIDEKALLQALNQGQISGVGLDVLSEEPPRDWTLSKHPKVILTPHIGGNADEAVLAMGRAAIRNLENYGDPLRYLD